MKGLPETPLPSLAGERGAAGALVGPLGPGPPAVAGRGGSRPESQARAGPGRQWGRGVLFPSPSPVPAPLGEAAAALGNPSVLRRAVAVGLSAGSGAG